MERYPAAVAAAPWLTGRSVFMDVRADKVIRGTSPPVLVHRGVRVGAGEPAGPGAIRVLIA